MDFKEKYDLPTPISILIPAFIHPSIKIEDPNSETYEVLETVGDTVLDLLIIEKLLLMKHYPDPAFLTLERSVLVNNRVLAEIAKMLDIPDKIIKANGHEIQIKDSADVLEAIFGIIFLNNGIDECRKFLEKIWMKWFDIAQRFRESVINESNPVGKLQEITQSYHSPLPKYEIIGKRGPEHLPEFEMKLSVEIRGVIHEVRSKSRSIKKAKTRAASKMLDKIQGKRG